ncbi:MULTISPECIES: sensor histidine kinase [Paenibacillus]|uniref:histidine kinase n=1 Tax=Paenibacillus albilobatus TaxID=2716884 RepID=A0A920CB35_9BACL|nr:MULTISPECIES: sensor histidine kinase [Paenibacillus]GIO31528.1 sensor histidine kinase YxjM [Paenibacillus albilobatus]
MQNSKADPKIPGAATRVRSLLFTLILAFSMVQNLSRAPLHEALPGAALMIGCLSLLWMPVRFKRPWIILAAASILWIGTMSFWLAEGLNATVYIVLIFLTGWVTSWVPSAHSAIFTAATCVASLFLLFYVSGQGPESLFTHGMGLAGIYLLMWGSKVRKDARRMEQRHLRELTEAHQQLEQAYAQLHEAHLELEEAAERSLRYAVLEERSRIAADIHDSIGHGLTSVIVQLQALPYMIRAAPDEARSALQSVTEIARGCLQDVRAVVHEMGLSHTGMTGLKKLADNFAERSGLEADFAADLHEQIPPEQIDVLYRILQEGLTNVLRHAEATAAEIRLSGERDRITMTIRDNGRAESPVKPGFGLSAMKARCEKAGGSLAIRTIHPHGLELVAQLPKKKG